MTGITWSEDYKTGIERIDKDHWGLFALVEDLRDKIRYGIQPSSVGVTIEALVDYIKVHFTYEEELLAQAGYEGLEEHIKLHRKLEKQVLEYKNRFASDQAHFPYDEFMTFLNSWLVNHITKSDMDYVSCLTGKDE